MKRHIRKIGFVLVLLLLVLGALLLVRQRKAELARMEPVPERPLPVHTTKVRQGTIQVTKHYLGTIEPRVSATVSAQISGRLESVRVDTGDPVEKDALIASVDDRELRQQLAARRSEIQGAQAELKESRKRYRRRKQLFAQGNVDEEALDAAKSVLASAQSRVKRLHAEIAAAEVTLTYTRIRAPFDGRVTARLKDPGDLVMPGQGVCRVENPAEGYRIRVPVAQETAARVHAGTPARLTGQAGEIETGIFRVHPATDANQMAVAEIRSKQRPFGLPSGAAVGVDLILDSPEGMILPRRAAVQYGGTWRVFVLDAGSRIRVTPVSLLGRSRDRIAVAAEELRAGDRVITGDESMLIRLGPDTRVAPVNPSTGPEDG